MQGEGKGAISTMSKNRLKSVKEKKKKGLTILKKDMAWG